MHIPVVMMAFKIGASIISLLTVGLMVLDRIRNEGMSTLLWMLAGLLSALLMFNIWA